jgi:uncharacterized LabA/DUF88 family protein
MISSGARSPTTYVFVDGEYLQRRLDALGKEWFGGPVQFDYSKLNPPGSSVTKVFYYDALPAQKENEPDRDFNQRLAEKESFFKKLRSINGWHVHEGVSKRPRGDRASQKEVDVLIAVDMLTHTHRRNMDRVVFIAGDQDFRPLVDAVVREGMYVDLWFDPSSISTDLKYTADARRELRLFDFHNFLTDSFRVSHRVPSYSIGGQTIAAADWRLQETGYVDADIVAKLWRDPREALHYLSSTVPVIQGVQFAHMSFADLDMLKRVYSHYFGPVRWEQPVINRIELAE